MVAYREGVAGSFSFDVTKRILDTLEAGGPINKTNLAQKTGLNYNVCLRYIKMLQLLGWIEMRSSDKGDHISVTEIGRQVSAKLLDASTNATVAAAVNVDSKRRPAKESYQADEGMKQQQQQQPPPGRPLLSSRAEKILKGSAKTGLIDPAKSRNIMIVDDEPDIVLTYEYYLTSEGYNAEAFSDSYSALREFTAKPSSYYDLVILDIRMPGLNGLQLYQSLKAMNPSCKIIFISALEAAKEMVTILSGVTMEDILKKPVDKESFSRKIHEILGQR
ncbi:MAG: response regulator [Nitrososphaera sp.]|jgi:CheY-like chemotaxis protein/predicted transcriptional regulator